MDTAIRQRRLTHTAGRPPASCARARSPLRACLVPVPRARHLFTRALNAARSSATVLRADILSNGASRRHRGVGRDCSCRTVCAGQNRPGPVLFD